MKTNFFIPQAKRESFNKMVNKVQKHISNVTVTCSKPYFKVFNHPVKDENGHYGSVEKYSHEVFDAEISIPDFNDWELLATYKDGALFVADFSKELVFANKKHGADYNKCDCCGHKMRKEMYVIRNKRTNEELQVGSECAKTFGIDNLRWVSKFYAELYSCFDYSLDYCSTDEIYPIWRGGNDESAFRSIEVNDVIKASKLYYDENDGHWKGGYYEKGYYYPSISKGELTDYVNEKKVSCNCSEKYIADMKKYIIDSLKNSDSEFELGMLNNIKNVYMSLADIHYIFFAIKKYETYLLSKNFTKFEVGQQLHINGKIISDKTEIGMFGEYHVITIELSNGQTLIRKGAVPNTNGIVNAYAIVNFYKNGITYLDRVTKHPKKNIAIVETK